MSEMKNRKKIISFIIMGIIVVVVCVSSILWKKVNSPHNKYEKGENETEFVPFPTEEKDEATDEQEEMPEKSEASDTSEKGKNDVSGNTNVENPSQKDNVDSTDTEDENPQDSDTTTDDDEQETEELPFVPF